MSKKSNKEEIFQEEEIYDEGGISLIADFKVMREDEKMEPFTDRTLPLLPLRNTVLFPITLQPISVVRNSSFKLIKDALKDDGLIAVVCQKDARIENPGLNDIYTTGTLAKVFRILELPNGSTTVVLRGIKRVKLKSIIEGDSYLYGVVDSYDETPYQTDKEFKLLIKNCRDMAANSFSAFGKKEEAAFALKNIQRDDLLINFLCSNIDLSIKNKIVLLNKESIKDRAYHLLTLLDQERQFIELQHMIDKKTHQEIDQQQKEYFLHQQMKNIQEELGFNIQEQDSNELRNKAKEKKWSAEVAEIFEREIMKLERINPQSPDYHVQLNYLQLFTSLPWGECSKDNFDIKNVRKVLDNDHYGLEKVKERIIEHLAVIKMRGDMKSPIICLYGPPGVGKTSLGKSIASALKRKYVRMSLGGVHDESEIRGHRKTYVGAMPGRILKNLVKAGTDNPVFILDEIDKVGQASMHGDPSSALLEVLDPEQNNTFHDNFLDIDYDLSNVMFIATANNLGSIPPPLLDRMELIEVSGYLTEEKIEIAKRHLVPKEKEANGIAKEKVTISKAALERIVEDYTRESGVRGLEKKIGKIFRRLAYQKATEGDFEIKSVKPENLQDLLGVKEFSRDRYQGNDYAGVVTGLAWTAVGGEILFIETSLSRGKGEKLTLTGNLGDVMKESAMLALEYVKSHAAEIGIPYEVFEKWNIHLHVPEGAIPKDGPSAGITMATALASALTQRKVRKNIAMTGEITLRGKVLPVGGIKEKILAAKRAGITDIIICEENRRNIEAIPEMYVTGLNFHYVNEVKDVLDIALLDQKVKNPIILTE